MARTFSVDFNIGASMGSFRRTVGNAQEQMQDLGSTIRQMNKQRLAAGNVQYYNQQLAELRRRQQQAGHSNTDLNRKIAETQRNLRAATREAEEHGVEVGQAAQQYEKLGAAISQAEKRMARMQKREQNQQTRQDIQGQFMGAAAAGAAVAFPIKQAMEFESKMADVKKVMEFESAGQFKAMREEVLRLSTQLPMAASGIGDIVAAAGQAGIAKKDLSEFAETAIKMGTAFDLSGKKAGKTMAGWRAAMGLSQEETEELADAVNHLSNNMNAEAGELARVINRQGAAAQAAGLHKTEVAALGATLLTSNQGAERSATALKKVTNALTAGASAPKRIKSSLQELGFSAEGMAKRMQEDAQGAIKSVFQALKDLPEAARPGMLQELFGKESQGVIAPLLGNLENLDQAFEKVSEKSRYAGSMQAEYAERSKTTSNQMQIFQNRITKLGITFGSILLPPLNKIMGVVGKFASGVADLSQKFPVITKLLIGSAAALVTFKVGSLAARYAQTLLSDAVLAGKAAFNFFRPPVLKTNAALAKQKAVAIGAAAKQRTLAVSTKLLTAAQWAWNVALSANPLGLVIAGVAALGVAALTLYKYWEPIAGFFKGVWAGISEGVSPVIKSLQPLFTLLSPLGTLFGWIGKLIGSVVSWFGSLLDPVDESARSVKNATNAGKAFGRVIGQVITGGLELAKQAFLNFTPLGWIIQAFTPVEGWLSKFSLWGTGKKIIGSLWSGLKFAFMNFSPLGLVIQGFQKVKSWLGNFSLKSAGQAILNTLVSGIKSVAGKAYNAVKDSLGWASKLLPGSDAKEGPLSGLTQAGKAIPDTIGKGIRNNAPHLKKTAQGALAGMNIFGSAAGGSGLQAGRGSGRNYTARPSIAQARGQAAGGTSSGPQVTINQTFNIDGSSGEPETEIRNAGEEVARQTQRSVEEYFQRGVRLGYA